MKQLPVLSTPSFSSMFRGLSAGRRVSSSSTGLMRGLRMLGSSDGVREEIHAIRSRRGQNHPLVQQVMMGAAAHTGP